MWGELKNVLSFMILWLINIDLSPQKQIVASTIAERDLFKDKIKMLENQLESNGNSVGESTKDQVCIVN